MEERLIVALDVGDLKSARKLVNKLSKIVGAFKIGSQLFTSCGTEAIDMVHKKRRKVFLDLKLHDIPNTVARATEAITAKKVFMFNVHASGGKKMMQEAVNSAEKKAKKLKTQRPIILGVTVLTSMGEQDIRELGIKRFVKDQALYLAKMAKDSRLDGVVASAGEAKRIKQLCGQDFIVVCPGIRPAGASEDDQTRISTPKGAIKEGADYIVVGRPIIEAKDPLAAAKKIIEEMKA